MTAIKNSEDSKCLHALFITNPLDDMEHIQDTKDRLLEGTCTWILDNPTYQTFVRDAQSQILWIHGDPGKGKTFLAMSQILKFTEHIRSPASVNTTLLYFFCDNKDDRRNNAVAILRGLLYQLFCQYPGGIRHLRNEYDKQKDQLFQSTNSQQALWRIFESVLQEIPRGRFWVVIDALDECDPETLRILLDRIKARNDRAISHEKWLLTSRNERHIKDFLNNTLNISLESNNKSVERDIQRFIDDKARQLGDKRLSPVLKSFVIDTLREKAQGTFLWVSLAYNELRNVTPIKIKSTLQRLPSGLTAIYEKILKQALEDEDLRESIRDILISMLIAVRPLTLQEVAIIAALPVDYREDISSIREYTEECGSLVTIQKGRLDFVHQSAKDFLLSTSLLGISHNREKEHYIVLTRCFRYICSGVFSTKVIIQDNSDNDSDYTSSYDSENGSEYTSAEESEKEFSHTAGHKVLKYPALFWMVHGVGSGSGVKDILDQNLEFWHLESELRDVWLQYYRKVDDQLPIIVKSFAAIHLAAYFGVVELIKELLASNKHDIDLKDSGKNTPMEYAAHNGHETMVKLLLEKGADVNQGGRYDNALQAASAGGHKAVVNALQAAISSS